MPKFIGEEPDKGIILCSGSGPCHVCKAETNFADVDFQAWICSTDCQDKLIGNFQRDFNA